MRGKVIAAALVIVLLATSLLSVQSARAAIPTGFSEAVLQIEVNGSAASEMVVALRDSGNNIWLDADDFVRLRLNTPNREPLLIDGVKHFPLQAIPGAVVTVDEATLRVALTVPATAFAGTNIALEERPNRVYPRANFGGFVNYELSAEHDDVQNAINDASSTFETAYAELGFFGPHGVITNSAIGHNAEESRRATRLETTWTYDFPSQLQTLRVGDVIGSSGRWSRAARFGGIQWGSNFGVRPDLVTTPLLSAVGEAVVPSAVDVFINNQQVASRQVPAGPFVIDRLPAISGAGDVRLVIRDAFGREQIITAPFYSSATLLKKDLAQYSVEFGKIRENFAIASNDYGTPVASATYRRGMTDALTLEAHGESQQNGPHAVGIDAALRIGGFGVVTATLAQGADDKESGYLVAASFERGGPHFSVNARSQVASDGFRQVGDAQLASRPKQQHILQTSANFYRFGSLALAYAVATYQNEPRREVGTLSHNVSLPNIGYLGLSISRTWSQQNSTSAFLILTAPIGATRSASLTARYDSEASFEQHEAIATFQQNPPIGNGTGYRLSASTANNYSGSWLRQFDYAAVEVEAAKYLQTTAQRATLAGAGVAIGGDLFATRSVTDSFALVDVADIPDMAVMVDNQVVRHTDKNGHALIRNLRAYDSNRISVDPRQLPLDTRIDSDRMTISPRYRSGVVVNFPVARERSGTFKLVLVDGRPVPTGAEVILKGNRFPVALDGLVYVTGLDHGMSARAEWNGGQCDFRLDAPPSDDPLPDMGTIVCRAEP